MTNKLIIYLLCCMLCFSTPPASANSSLISLDLQNINLIDALRLMAKFMHLNVVISPAINGAVSLHLQNASALKAFDLLLISQGLAKYQEGNVWFIAPAGELMKRVEEAVHLQTLATEAAPLATRIWQMRYAKAEDIAHVLRGNNYSLLSKRGHIRVDGRTNSLCIQDIADNFPAINQLLKKLDIPVQQILIDARLASIDHHYEKELGIDFTTCQRSSVNSESSKHFSLAIAKLADTSILDMQLIAMEQNGHGEVISRPSLFTANQQTALIESGEEIPYQETTESGATSVAFKKAVLRLKVTPQVLPGDQVLLQLEINQDKPSSRIVLGVPTISTRQIATNIQVHSGQTIVLGGIYEASLEADEQRIPFLGKIPLVGLLFQQHNLANSKRELLIFVTPKIYQSI